jgi:uncharacterized protein YbjT (DUF2867 family)
MKRSAVVFGSTGLIGRELLNELLSDTEYERVTAVTRRKISMKNPKLEQVIIDDYSGLGRQKDKLKATDYFCCIGTTIKTAGSQEAFRKVDYSIPLQIAKLAADLNVPNLVVVSSIGARADARNFYLRTKGEMEQEVENAYSGNLKFARPSLLMGNREERRFGEKIGIYSMTLLGWMFFGPLRKYRGIHAHDVARAMIKSTRLPAAKRYLESDELIDLLK